MLSIPEHDLLSSDNALTFSTLLLKFKASVGNETVDSPFSSLFQAIKENSDIPLIVNYSNSELLLLNYVSCIVSLHTVCSKLLLQEAE